jgi:hypothetical protein
MSTPPLPTPLAPRLGASVTQQAESQLAHLTYTVLTAPVRAGSILVHLLASVSSSLGRTLFQQAPANITKIVHIGANPLTSLLGIATTLTVLGILAKAVKKLLKGERGVLRDSFGRILGLVAATTILTATLASSAGNYRPLSLGWLMETADVTTQRLFEKVNPDGAPSPAETAQEGAITAGALRAALSARQDPLTQALSSVDNALQRGFATSMYGPLATKTDLFVAVWADGEPSDEVRLAAYQAFGEGPVTDALLRGQDASTDKTKMVLGLTICSWDKDWLNARIDPRFEAMQHGSDPIEKNTCEKMTTLTSNGLFNVSNSEVGGLDITADKVTASMSGVKEPTARQFVRRLLSSETDAAFQASMMSFAVLLGSAPILLFAAGIAMAILTLFLQVPAGIFGAIAKQAKSGQGASSFIGSLLASALMPYIRLKCSAIVLSAILILATGSANLIFAAPGMSALAHANPALFILLESVLVAAVSVGAIRLFRKNAPALATSLKGSLSDVSGALSKPPRFGLDDGSKPQRSWAKDALKVGGGIALGAAADGAREAGRSALAERKDGKQTVADATEWRSGLALKPKEVSRIGQSHTMKDVAQAAVSTGEFDTAHALAEGKDGKLSKRLAERFNDGALKAAPMPPAPLTARTKTLPAERTDAPSFVGGKPTSIQDHALAKQYAERTGAWAERVVDDPYTVEERLAHEKRVDLYESDLSVHREAECFAESVAQQKNEAEAAGLRFTDNDLLVRAAQARLAEAKANAQRERFDQLAGDDGDDAQAYRALMAQDVALGKARARSRDAGVAKAKATATKGGKLVATGAAMRLGQSTGSRRRK